MGRKERNENYFEERTTVMIPEWLRDRLDDIRDDDDEADSKADVIINLTGLKPPEE